MTKSEWRKQYHNARWLYRKFPESYWGMKSYKRLHDSVKQALDGWTVIYMSSQWLRPQKLTRTLIHQRMNARIVK